MLEDNESLSHVYICFGFESGVCRSGEYSLVRSPSGSDSHTR